MHRRPIYPSNSINCVDLLWERQYSDVDIKIRNRLHTGAHLIDKLELDLVFEGHNGCVNCLEWSENGRTLASGSDDFHIMFWDIFKGKCTLDLKTPHTGNIFSVKFMPKSGGSIVASGAGDKFIHVFNVERNNEPIWSCDCHSLRVKRLATSPDSPFVFWSAGEDGNILQLDTREHHKCGEDDPVLLLNLTKHIGSQNAEAKCIAINPRRPELLAVGASDTYARLYDRRMIKLSSVDYTMDPIRKAEHNCNDIPTNCVTYFCPGHCKNNTKYIGHDSKTITYLTFNSDGTELLVNMGAEHIYLYDINHAKEPVFLDLPEYKKNTDSNTLFGTEQTASKRTLPEHVEIYKKMGNDFLENEKYLRAIDQYSKAIQMAPDCPILYLNRATALMRRMWYGDDYAALRDCHIALKLDPSYIKAHFRLARALLVLGKIEESEECLKELIARFPNYANNHGVMMLKKDIAVNAEHQRKTKSPESFGMLVLSENERAWRAKSKDYQERFVGHCNTTTDIKEANFFGADGQYIVAGSDDGNFFIWERPTNKIKTIYKGDMAIVNCVQPHPYLCYLATSGIDHEIKVWSPSVQEDQEKSLRAPYMGLIVDSNQHKMRTDPFDLNTQGAYCRNS